jgi:hypothetical protein
MTGNGRRVAAAIVALGLFGTLALAQSDPLADARARQQASDTRAKDAAARTIKDAEQTAKTNLTRAVQDLKKAKDDINLAFGVSNTVREEIIAQYQAKINALEGRPVEKAGPKLDPRGPIVREERAAAMERYKQEVQDVREGIERIAYYQSKNDPRSAQDVIQRLSRTYPNDPAVIFLTQKDSLASAVADARAMNDLMGKRVVASLNSVQKSAIPIAGDIEFPANWKDISERRKKMFELKLTPKEKSLIEALDKPVSISVIGRPMLEVLTDISTQMGEQILVDPKSLADLGIDLQRPVTIQAKGLSARTVLRQVLGGAGLTFVMRDEAILAVTVEKARDLLVTRVYYLGDIVRGVGPLPGGAPTWGPWVDYQQTMANAKLIVDAIQSSIDPLSWRDKGGGPGSIAFDYPSMSLIVRASTEVHATLGSKLPGGR